MVAAGRLAGVADERAEMLWQHLGSAYAAGSLLNRVLGAGELDAEGADGWNGEVEAWEESCRRVVDDKQNAAGPQAAQLAQEVYLLSLIHI